MTSTATQPKFRTRIQQKPEQRTALIKRLNAMLATGQDLASQVKYCHWNIRGLQFVAVHELLDEMAAELREHLDTIAERANTLGGVAEGTVRQSAEGTLLSAFPNNTFSVPAMIDELANQYAAYSALLKESSTLAADNDDPATEDMFVEVLRSVDLRLWFLEAHLEQ